MSEGARFEVSDVALCRITLVMIDMMKLQGRNSKCFICEQEQRMLMIPSVARECRSYFDKILLYVYAKSRYSFFSYMGTPIWGSPSPVNTKGVKYSSSRQLFRYKAQVGQRRAKGELQGLQQQQQV